MKNSIKIEELLNESIRIQEEIARLKNEQETEMAAIFSGWVGTYVRRDIIHNGHQAICYFCVEEIKRTVELRGRFLINAMGTLVVPTPPEIRYNFLFGFWVDSTSPDEHSYDKEFYENLYKNEKNKKTFIADGKTIKQW